jgi:predicted transposase/invertase (TIGR01784 family)
VREDALEQGLKRGVAQKTVEIARNLLSLKVPVAEIAKATGLTVEQVRAL